jgi:hypothetical protein
MATALQRTLRTSLPIFEATHVRGPAEAASGAVVRYQAWKYYRDLAINSECRDQLTHLLEPFEAA